MEYRQKLVEQWKSDSTVRRVSERRHMPQSVHSAVKLKREMLEARKVKEDRRRKHTKAGREKPKPERKSEYCSRIAHRTAVIATRWLHRLALEARGGDDIREDNRADLSQRPSLPSRSKILCSPPDISAFLPFANSTTAILPCCTLHAISIQLTYFLPVSLARADPAISDRQTVDHFYLHVGRPLVILCHGSFGCAGRSVTSS